MSTNFRQQQGMALLVSLVVLIVVSVLGATAMRSALFQSRISVNSQASQQIFQGAESGLEALLDHAVKQIEVDGYPPQDPRHIFYKALSTSGNTVQRLCFDEKGTTTVTTDATRAPYGDEWDFDYPDCDERPGSPVLVTTVVTEPPAGIPPSLPIEGTNLCGNQGSCYATTQVYSRAFASIAGMRNISSHVQLWGIVAPDANEGN